MKAVIRTVQSRRKMCSLKCTVFKEVKMPVPWGHISGKWWGDKSLAPIIAIHDFRQNAAAFDKVIPKLHTRSVLAIDLPGHGQSSHFYKGRHFTQLEYLYALRHLTRQLPTGLISFLGHGFGSSLAFLYSGAYSQTVNTIVSIECSRHILSQFNFTVPNIVKDISDRIFDLEKEKARTFSDEKDLLENIRSSSRDMSEEAAQILLCRSIRKEDGKISFTHDSRNEIFPVSFLTEADTFLLDEQIRAKTLMIRNLMDDEILKLSESSAGPACFDKNTAMLIRRDGADVVRSKYMQGLERLRASCRYFAYKEIRSPKHILLDSSEVVASHINEFIGTDLERHEYFT